MRICVSAVLVAGLTTAATPFSPVAQAAGPVTLMPDTGQYVSVPMVKILDTRSGLGEPSAAPLFKNTTLNVAVTGSDGVPASADAVVVNLNAINVTAAGTLEAYDTESPDPLAPSVALIPGVNTTVTDTIPISSAGTVTLSNSSTAAMDVAMTVIGYFTGSQTAAGDTYRGLSWTMIADTTTGTGVPQAKVQPGGSITVQVGGNGGVPAGAPIAALQINAMNTSTSGYLTAYPAGSADPGLASLSYDQGVIYRNLTYTPLSASGQVKITNHGSAAVDVTVYTRGYFLPPASAPAAGVYTSIDPYVVYDASSSHLAANATVTIQASDSGASTDQGIIPQDVTQLAEEVVVTNPTAKGAIDLGVPGSAPHATVNFLPATATYVGFDTALVSLAPAGKQTIVNDSAAAVSVKVVVVGFFEPPTVPNPPASVTAAVSGTATTVSWTAPDTDGGSPITGYTVTATPDAAQVTVAAGTLSATLTGLTHAATDTYTVTATNAAGMGDGTDYHAQPATVAGNVRQPSGAPMANDTVYIYSSEPPDPAMTTWTPVQIGTATTDANGDWSFTLPPYASLPADAQAAATNGNGYLNVQAVANGTAVVGGITYIETANAFESAWVGTGTAVPLPSGAPTPQTMTLYPQGPDNSAQVTPTTTAATYASTHDVQVTNNVADDLTAAPTDAYGFQEIGGDGTYNPFVAAGGVNLASVPVTAVTPQDNPCYPDPETQVGGRWDKWVVIGEAHAWWDASGAFKYGVGGSTAVGAVFSLDAGADWTAGGSFTYVDSQSGGWSQSMPLGDHQAHQVQMHMWFKKVRTGIHCIRGLDRTALVIREAGIDNPAGSGGPLRFMSASLTGEDGATAFHNSPPGNRNWLHRGVTLCIHHGYSRFYSAGVSLAGLSVFVQTTISNDTSQCITAGTKRTRKHWIWGRNGQYTDRNPRVLYSY